MDAAAESPGALRPAEPHGAELPVRGRPAGQRAELPGQARPEDKCSTASGRRRLRATGLNRKAKLTQLPPHEEGQPTLWAIGIEGPSPLRLPEAEQYPLHVSLAFDDELSDQEKRDLEQEWGEERETTLHFHKFTSGAAGELSLNWDPVANSESVQRARESSSYRHRPLHISL